jgi:uroporphyrinogen III methyltransferase/synthase
VAGEARIGAPATIVVGPVVGLRERLRWFDRRPLFGRRVLVTRTREQAGTLAALLRERGAESIELPTIHVSPPTDWDEVDRAIGRLAEYDWVIFTSANGVRYFFERLDARGLDARALGGARLATIGPATAAVLGQFRLKADFVPTEYVAEAVVEEMGRFDLAGRRVLLPRAREAREVLATGLAARGAVVDEVAVYETRPAGDADEARRLFASRQIDVVTLTSSSTARNLVQLLGEGYRDALRDVVIASIGPITSQTARDLGLSVQVEAAEHTIPGLVEALEKHLADPAREAQFRV